jgi:hypothetical protein
VLERLQHIAQCPRAQVELLVEGIDLGFGVNLVAVPVALRAAAPESPVAAIAGLLQQVGWTSEE